MNNNIINFNDYKKSDTEVENIPKYEDIKESIKKSLDDGYTVVGRNELEARAIGKIMMEMDDTIRYCKISYCISHIKGNQLFEIDPIRVEGNITYADPQLGISYAKYLDDNDLVEIVDGIGGFLKD